MQDKKNERVFLKRKFFYSNSKYICGSNMNLTCIVCILCILVEKNRAASFFFIFNKKFDVGLNSEYIFFV